MLSIVNATNQGWWFEKALRNDVTYSHTASNDREGINTGLQPPPLPSSAQATLRLCCFLNLLLF